MSQLLTTEKAKSTSIFDQQIQYFESNIQLLNELHEVVRNVVERLDAISDSIDPNNNPSRIETDGISTVAGSNVHPSGLVGRLEGARVENYQKIQFVLDSLSKSNDHLTYIENHLI